MFCFVLQPQTAAAAEPSPSKEPEKKTKIVTKSVDLPVSARVPSLSADELNVLLEQELHMISQDKLEKERADAKNAVEEYVYDMRDKISSTFEAFTKEAVRPSLLRSTLDHTTCDVAVLLFRSESSCRAFSQTRRTGCTTRARTRRSRCTSTSSTN